MSRSAVALAALAMLTASVVAVPTAPAPRPAFRPVATLIQALGSPDFAEREAASHELDLVGPPALPDLQREIAKTADREVFRRVSQLLARLEKRLADEQALAPKMVEIRAVDESLERIVADLSKQTGYEVLVSVPAKKVSLKTGLVTFWDAIEQLNEAAELQIASVGGTKAAKTPVASSGAITPTTLSDRVVEPLVRPNPPAADPVKDAATKLEQLKKDFEKVAKAREDVAKEVNATARARAAALEKIKAEMEARLREAQRELELRKKGTVPPPAAPVAKAAEIPAPGVSAPPLPIARNPANSIVLEPRIGAKRPATNFGAVRLEAMPMPASAAVPDAVAAMVQVWAEPRLQWQQARGVRIRQAHDAHGQALLANADSAIATGPTVIDGNGIQVVRNVNGGVVIINNGGGNVVINGQINGQVIVNNGNVILNNGTSASGTAPNPRQVVVKLQPGEKETDSLRELTGVIEAVVKVSARELVKIDDLSTPSEARHPSVRLKTSGLAKSDDGRYALEVEIEFNPNQVQPGTPPSDANPGAANPLPIPGRGRLINNGSGPIGSASRVYYGLQVTDEAGKPVALQAHQTGTTHLGGSLITMKFSFKVHLDSRDAPAPKSIRFWGTHSASVDIPFHLVNVPTLAAKK